MIVTALVLHRDGRTTHGVDNYLTRFRHLAETGLPITLFLDRTLAGRVEYANVEVHRVDFASLPLARDVVGEDVQLPRTRNEAKDTADFLAIVNAKLDFVRLAALANPGERRVSWVDFGVAHVFSNPAMTLRKLHDVDRAPRGVTMGGPWRTSHGSLDDVSWRFAGAFVTADRDSALRFADEHDRMARSLLPRLTWEVNVWARMERLGVLGGANGIPLTWYPCDHDDTLLNFPVSGMPW